VVRRACPARAASVGAGGEFFFSPAEFARAYGLDRGTAVALDGSGVTIGLPAFSQIGSDDLVAFRTRFGLPRRPRPDGRTADR
jgi:hypothetical protein